MDADQITATIARIITGNPLKNPYSLLDDYFQSQTQFGIGRSLQINYKVNTGLMAFCVFVSCLVVIGKARQGFFWLFTKHKTPRGSIIVPNGSLLYTLCAMVSASTAIAVIWLILTNQKEGLALFNVPFIFLGLALWSETFYAYTMSYIHFNSRARLASAPLLFKIQPWLVNFGIVAIYCVDWMCVLPTIVKSVKSYYQLSSNAQMLSQGFQNSASGWSLGDLFQWNLQWTLLLQNMAISLRDFEHYTEVTYLIFFAKVFCLVTTYLTCLFYYWKSITLQQNKESDALKRTGSFTGQQIAGLTKAITFIKIQAVAAISGGIAYSALALYAGIQTNHIFSNARAFGIVAALDYYTFAFSATSVVCLSCYGAWHDYFAGTKSAVKTTAIPAVGLFLGIKVEVERIVTVDDRKTGSVTTIDLVPLGLDLEKDDDRKRRNDV